jgi:excisionase family DNA binding protein
MEEFLTVAQVAERLKLNQQTVRNWIDAGTLPAYRVGRRVRVSQADFDRFVAASYTGSRSGDDERGGPAAGISRHDLGRSDRPTDGATESRIRRARRPRSRARNRCDGR